MIILYIMLVLSKHFTCQVAQPANEGMRQSSNAVKA